MSKSNWVRVGGEISCPVCGKRDWCLVSADGTAAICPRVESKKQCGEAGWLHVLAERPENAIPVSRKKDRRVEDMTELAEQFRRAISPGGVKALADTLGVSEESVRSFRVGWSRDAQAWAIPSYNPLVKRVTGIQLRRSSGKKFSVRGSKFALFTPDLTLGDDTLLALEGASDAMAAHTVGFPLSVGRFNCGTGAGYVVALIQELKPARVVVVADRDKPNKFGVSVGFQGAVRMVKVFKYHCKDVRVVSPPEGVKDFRAWASAGLTRSDIEREWNL